MKTLIEYWKSLKFRSAFLGALLFGCLSWTGPTVYAQADTTRLIEAASVPELLSDTTEIKRLDPRKALFYSAVLPGLGQIYNGKYWKLPLVYGGFAVTISVVSFYQKAYMQYRDELLILLADGGAVSPSGRTVANLRYIVDKARRERDYYVIITGIWYLLQIVDAHVDAHLQEFKVNKDLKLSLEPSINQNAFTGRTTGLSLTLKF